MMKTTGFCYTKHVSIYCRIVFLYTISINNKILQFRSLVELKNRLIPEDRYTDCVVELIFKIVNVPVKKIEIEHIRHITQSRLFLFS